MLWVINCVDKPNTANTRAELLQQHRKYLDEMVQQIFFSGPQQNDDATEMLGSLFIINVPSRAKAQAFIEGETFFRAGVFDNVTITRVRKGRFQPSLLDVE
jgi:uncharacterized protein YciI